jgi:hypothetical protein
MTLYLRQSTASQEIVLGPFLDSTDGNTEETALTIANTDIKLYKAGATAGVSKNSGGATHDAAGRYSAVLDATDTDTLGNLEVHSHPSGALPTKREYVVLTAAMYDWLVAGTGTKIEDDVWDAVRANHADTGSFGEVSSVGDIADAVWDEARSGHTTSGTFGEMLNITSAIKKNVARNNFVFQMFDSTTKNPATGLTVSCFLSKDGALTFTATSTATATEMANGWYKINLTQTEMNADVIAFRATATGADPTGLVLITQS